MVLYKKEFCPSVCMLALMCLNYCLCQPRVLSSAGIKRSLTGTAINPFKIVYSLVSLKFFLLFCKSVQPRSWIRVDLRWYTSCLFRNVQQLCEFCLIYQYHLACTDPIEKYAISYNFEGHPFKFLLKKPSVELAD